jgi:hypothetical protein
MFHESPNLNQCQIFMNFFVSIQINQPTRCKNFTSLLLDVYVWLNMFRASTHPSSGAYNCTMSLWFYRWKEAAGALLVVVCQTPETYWATHKRQVINVWNCCIFLVKLFKSYDDARTCEGQIFFISSMRSLVFIFFLKIPVYYYFADCSG